MNRTVIHNRRYDKKYGQDITEQIAVRILGLTFGSASIRFYPDRVATSASAGATEVPSSTPVAGRDEGHSQDGDDFDFSKQFIDWVLGEGYAAGRVRPKECYR